MVRPPGRAVTGINRKDAFTSGCNVGLHGRAGRHDIRQRQRQRRPTFAAVALLSLMAHLLPLGLAFRHLSPVLAAVLGGLLCGAGMLILFRHRASLGGLNTLVLYLQDRFGWRAGKVQTLLDGLILLAALFVADLPRVALSVLGAVVLNLTLAINHRPGRYLAV